MNRKEDILLKVCNLSVQYKLKRGLIIKAVSDVSFSIKTKETLGLVGESGCGKTSVAQVIAGLLRPQNGKIIFDGQDLVRAAPDKLRQLRRKYQMLFQDAVAALNPRRKIGHTVAEPLRLSCQLDQEQRNDAARQMMLAVGLDPKQYFNRRPHEFSGGQCQRIQIARALILKPKLLICDEPVSSLDVSIQAQIMNLLEDMRQKHDLTLLFISHDLSVVKVMCDRVAVMYLGRLCEIAASEVLYQRPLHPYTAALMAAILKPNPEPSKEPNRMNKGEPPSPINPPDGCRFHPRCPYAKSKCRKTLPLLKSIAAGRCVACHYPLH